PENVAAPFRGVEAPLLDVPRLVVGPERADPPAGSDGPRSLPAEIRHSQDLRKNLRPEAHSGGAIPVIHGRKALARELGVRRPLAPAPPAAGEAAAPPRIRPELPRGGPGPSRHTPEARHRLCPWSLAPVADERLFPVLAFRVAAGVHERLEVPVRHL